MAVLVAVPAVLVATALPAHADSVAVFGVPSTLCTDKGLSTNSLMLTNTTKDGGVTCAYVAGSGRKSIKPGQTSSWSSSSPQGVASSYKCYGDDAKNITYANSYVGSDATGYTYRVQPTNWNSSTKHWGGAILWSTAAHKNTSIQSSQYKASCNGDDGRVDAARMYPVSISMVGSSSGVIGTPSSFTVSVNGSAYGGSSPAAGQVALMVMKGDAPDPTADIALVGAALANGSATLTTSWKYRDASGAVQQLDPDSYKIYGAYAGSVSSTPVIPSVGWFKMATSAITVSVSATASGALSASGSLVRVSAAPARKPAPFSGVMQSTIVEAKTRHGRGGLLSVVCPTGGVPVQVNLLSSNPNVDLEKVILLEGGAAIEAPRNSSTAIQAICRPIKAKKARVGNLIYGSIRADRFDRSMNGAAVFAGFGDDVITLSGARAVAEGGLGSDTISVGGADSVAVGGFGNDTIRSTTSERTLLIGGLGADRLIGGTGYTLINARDGRSGDVIRCNSAQNVVMVDAGDITQGPCTVA